MNIIEIVPYNHSWQDQFQEEATKIKQVLGSNCIEIYHIGSTVVQVVTDLEWDAVKKLRQAYFLDNMGVNDPYMCSFKEESH